MTDARKNNRPPPPPRKLTDECVWAIDGAKEWPCPDTGRTCTADDCCRSCFENKRKPDAYITVTEQGEMVWTKEMYGEACMYCDEGEFPEPLFRGRKS